MPHILPVDHKIGTFPRPVGGQERALAGLPLVPETRVAAVALEAAPGRDGAVGLHPDQRVDEGGERRRPAPTPSTTSSGAADGTVIAPARPRASHAGGR